MKSTDTGEVQSLIAPRIIDHLKWAESLAVGTLLMGHEFKGQTDPTKCKFGEWYYGYTPPDAVKDSYRAIDEPHKRLHATAGKIMTAIRDGNHDLAKKIYQEETTPALEDPQAALVRMRQEFKSGLRSIRCLMPSMKLMENRAKEPRSESITRNRSRRTG